MLKRAFAAGGISVDTGNRDIGEQRSQRLLKLLSAQTYRHQMRRAAGGALARDRALAVAVVAAQMMLSLMQRVVAVAARALCYPAAVVAQQRRRESAAVQKQNDLVIGLQMLAHAANQRRGQPGLQLLAF